MTFHVLTLFPEMVETGLCHSVIGKAMERGALTLHVTDIRDYTEEKHGKVDDYPYGGGAGMLMQAQPVYDAWMAATGGRDVRTVYVTPQGHPFTQKMARELAGEEELVFLCGHYEGIDERVLEEVVTDRISLGDYVLTGGELAAMVMIDATARLLPGVLGNSFSAQEESFHNDLLEYPQYSRPEVWRGRQVPGILLCGDHRKVEAWRLEQSVQKTRQIRPDLYEKYQAKQDLVRQLKREKRDNIHMMESLSRGLGEILCACGDDVLIWDEASRVCMMNAENAESGWLLAERIPDEADWCLVSREFLTGILEERGFRIYNHCSQFLYTQKVPLPVRHKDIRVLVLEHLDYLCTHYGEGQRDYLRERIGAGAMYGGFVEGRLRGFVGIHGEGSIGFLYVEESCRRMGLAGSLVAYCVNRHLERGWIPYGHVVQGNVPSEMLQEKLGFYRAGRTFWWLSGGWKKSLAIRDCLW